MTAKVLLHVVDGDVACAAVLVMWMVRVAAVRSSPEAELHDLHA